MQTQPKRDVKCQICPWRGTRYYGAKGILVDPCPQCGSRVTYAAPQKGDMPLTADPNLLVEAA